jgi:protein-disulfide isomerase
MQSNSVIASSVIVAGLIIAGAIVYTGSDDKNIEANLIADSGEDKNKQAEDFGNNLSDAASTIRPVSREDHILGDPNAPVSVVEFSDLECPFCARFHSTMERIVAEYDGQVNWVYRHFPLTSIHAKATEAAVASECIATLAGNDAFWQFASGVFNNQQSLGLELYTQLAGSAGVSASDLEACVAKGDALKEVEKDSAEVVVAGGRGTPFNIVISKKGEFFPFSGALPYEQVKGIIEQALTN